jgi:hypothetical protein
LIVPQGYKGDTLRTTRRSGAPLQRHHFTVPFQGLPHGIGTSCLAEVCSGELNYTAGVALACFANYAWQNSDGDVLVVDVENVASFIEVQDCVSITIAVDVVAATAMGGWIFYPVT